ncbi:MAG TPA: chemotaxis protein CheA [Anaeromyxobacteraceae bacterium]|nr:chemotaxis protein CheA [Anaeromyxobacteraceae bacterium]
MSSSPQRPGRAPGAILEETAAAVVVADASDPESLQRLSALCQELHAALRRESDKAMRDLAGTCVEALARAAANPADAAKALDAVNEAVMNLQMQVSRPAAAHGPEPRQQVPERVDRDPDTVSLFGDFLQESAEGLSRADQILMAVEEGGATSEHVNSLFRVFHTIKGTAGFLELQDVVDLAHTTETMLNRCRQGELKLEGEPTDLSLEATAVMRAMLDAVKVAVEQSLPFSRAADLTGLVARIQAATESAGPDKDARAQQVPAAPPPRPPAEAAPADPAPREAAPAAAPAATPVPSPKQPAAPAPASLTPAPTPPRAATPAPEAAPAHPAEPPAAPEGRPSGDGTVKLKDTVKVDLERVDSLVAMIGELVVVESMVVNAPEIVQTASPRVRNCLGQLAKVTRDLQDVGMRMRMVPVSGVFQKMARLTRDLGRKAGKQVRMQLAGETTEMDRSMVEQIADPLVHLIRNACDHGIEPSEARLAAGKPAEGTLRLSAYHEGGSIVIEIADDGRGLDREAIVQKAVRQGLIRSPEGMSDADIDALIFAPGFSTAKQVTEISGRGVGMDVVKKNVEAMRGRVTIQSRRGVGTTFKLVLPLTLAIIDGMLVACGEERYIVPTLSIVESLRPDREMLVSMAQVNEMVNLRGQILPLLRLDRLFDLEGARTDPTQALVVVVEGIGQRVGLLVDEVIAQQQVVIKTLGEGLGETPYVAGGAILSDGRVGLILNIEQIVSLSQRRAAGRPPPARPSAARTAAPQEVRP